jgi:hypothetical protein
MASIGQGVNKDATVPAVRLTFYTDAHADAQNDQANNFRYDLSKIWACMGRVGANGVMRDGFIERGNPYLGYAAASIEEFQGGVFLAEKWDTLVAWTLNGVAGDMLYIGGNWPWDDALLHLAGVVVGPSPVVYEYWNGAWVAATLTLTPDLTGATGLNQRLRCARPTDWVKVAGGAAGEIRYWRRIRQTGAGAVVTGNTTYKDFIQGHVRDFFCQYDLKKGDDGAGVNTSEFKDDSPFTLRFEDGRKFDSRTTIATFVQLGSISNLSRRSALGKPWSLISNVGHVVHPCKLYGGYVMGNARTYAAGTAGVALRGQNSEVVGTRVAGFHENVLGAAGVTALIRAQDIRVSIDRDAAAAGLRPINNMSIDPGGVADDITIDVHDVATAVSVNTSIASPTFRGLQLTGDGGTAQIFRAGSGPLALYAMRWGGPRLKVVNGTPATPGWDIGRLPFRVWRRPDFVPLAGIAVRAFGSDGFKQLEGVTDVNGQCLTLQNQTPSIAVIGIQNQSVFISELFTDASGATSILLDEPMRIEINPADHVAYNPAYETITRYTRWPRELVYDATVGAYGYQDWQRVPVFPIDEALGPPPPPPAPPPDYVRRDLPETPYTPVDVAAPTFSRRPVAAGVYTRAPSPGTGFRPRGVPATGYHTRGQTGGGGGWGLEWGLSWGGPTLPSGGLPETDFTHRTTPHTDYTPKGAP